MVSKFNKWFDNNPVWHFIYSLHGNYVCFNAGFLMTTRESYNHAMPPYAMCNCTLMTCNQRWHLCGPCETPILPHTGYLAGETDGHPPWYIGGEPGVDSQRKQRHLKERRSGVSHPGAPCPPTQGQPPWTARPCSRETLGSLKGEDLQPKETSQPYPGLIGLTPWTYRANTLDLWACLPDLWPICRAPATCLPGTCDLFARHLRPVCPAPATYLPGTCDLSARHLWPVCPAPATCHGTCALYPRTCSLYPCTFVTIYTFGYSLYLSINKWNLSLYLSCWVLCSH